MICAILRIRDTRKYHCSNVEIFVHFIERMVLNQLYENNEPKPNEKYNIIREYNLFQ